MAFKCKSVNISYYRVKCLRELVRAVDCFTLGGLGIVVKSPSVVGGDPPMARFTLLSYCDDIGLVPEASTYKELMEFFWYELSVTPTLFFICGVSKANAW